MSSSSQIFIIDEWMWSDLEGKNGRQKIEETFKFITSVYDICDKIATIKGSKFERKFFNLCKQTDNFSRKIVRFYMNCIFYNSEKYVSVNEEECHQTSENILSEINIDDQYLIKLHYRLKCSIITTDNQLLEVLKKYQIPCEHRDIFLQRYIEGGNKTQNSK